MRSLWFGEVMNLDLHRDPGCSPINQDTPTRGMEVMSEPNSLTNHHKRAQSGTLRGHFFVMI